MMVVANTSLFALRIKDRSWSRQISRRTSGVPASALVLNAAFSAAVLWAEPASGAYMLLLVAACLPTGLSLRRNACSLRPIPDYSSWLN
jgi:hypothetical protein